MFYCYCVWRKFIYNSESSSVHHQEFIHCTLSSGICLRVCRQLSSRSICSCSKAIYKPVWHVPLLSLQWINSWWWTDELSETCIVSRQNKFVKLVHLVGFIVKKFVTMHGHMNVKYKCWVYISDTFFTNLYTIFKVILINHNYHIWITRLPASIILRRLRSSFGTQQVKYSSMLFLDYVRIIVLYFHIKGQIFFFLSSILLSFIFFLFCSLCSTFPVYFSRSNTFNQSSYLQ